MLLLLKCCFQILILGCGRSSSTVSASVATMEQTSRRGQLLLFRGKTSLPERGGMSTHPRRRSYYYTSPPLPAAGGLWYARRPSTFTATTAVALRRNPCGSQRSRSHRAATAAAFSRKKCNNGDLLASSSSSSTTTTRLVSTKTNVKADDDSLDPSDYSYDDLTVVGRVIAGVVEIGCSVAIEYVTGFVSGYFLGSLTGLPALLTQGLAATDVAAAATTRNAFWKEVVGRTARMHGKSVTWAQRWAGISAAFGGFKVGTRVLRNNKEDEWNTILSSMAAGAFFARAGKQPTTYDSCLNLFDRKKALCGLRLSLSLTLFSLL